MKRHIYLFGYPLDHTLSPQLHNSYFSKMKLPLTYEARPIHPANFQDEVPRLMREDSFIGANVTIPYKAEIIPLLDGVQGEVAKTVQAVNTIVRTPEGLIGYNTDGPAFREMLRDAGWECVNSAMIVGTGGGAQAAIWALAGMGCNKLTVIYNSQRRLKRLRALLRRLEKRASFFALVRLKEFFQWAENAGYLRESPSPELAMDPLENYVREAAASSPPRTSTFLPENNCKQFDLLVNATPVGLHPHADEVLIDHPRFFRLFQAVADLVYNPQRTKLLFLAHLAGCQTISGMKMLEAQAAYSRELWLAELER